MMSPGRRVTRSFVAKGKKKKVVVPRKKKKNHPGYALPMSDDPVSSLVLHYTVYLIRFNKLILRSKI
jgi:hypothetical protein